jgi:hypothetical protein
MAETPQQTAARIAERNRVDTYINSARAQQRTAAVKTALTPEEIAAQKAALLRQQLIQQYAPAPAQTGLQALLNALGFGQKPQP